MIGRDEQSCMVSTVTARPLQAAHAPLPMAEGRTRMKEVPLSRCSVTLVSAIDVVCGRYLLESELGDELGGDLVSSCQSHTPHPSPPP